MLYMKRPELDNGSVLGIAGGKDNIKLISAQSNNGFLILEWSRPLGASDQFDRAIDINSPTWYIYTLQEDSVSVSSFLFYFSFSFLFVKQTCVYSTISMCNMT